MSLALQRLTHACAAPHAGHNTPAIRHMNSYVRRAASLRLLTIIACFAFATSASAQTIDVRPAASKDDAEQRADNSMYTGSSDLELTFDGNTQTIGIRFPGITIPKNATITSAWVQFRADQTSSEATNLVIAGQAADNALAFASTAGDITNRPQTAETVAWSNIAAWTSGQTLGAQRTPELKTIIKAIVDRANWASGNALVLIITGTGHRTATAWDGGAANAPLLHVEYTTGAPVNGAPTAVLNVSQALSPALTVNASAAGSSDGDAWPIASYTFNWGDGTPNTVVSAPTQTASHTYAAGGPYTVTLTATDSGSPALTSAPATKSITVVANSAPVGVLNVSQPQTPFYTVNATAAGSTDTDPWPIASYTFDWGDGSAATTVNSPTQTASHTYAGANAYTVTLTVKDTDNAISTPVTKSITVNPPPPNNAPVAALNLTQAGTPPLTVNASAAGSTDSDPWPITSYTFNWGDGTANTVVSAPTQTATHTYASGGNKTVTVTATDNGTPALTSAPVSKVINVISNTAPVAVLTASVLSSPARTIHASGAGSTDTDAMPIASYTFTWGDGTANTTVNAPAWSTTHAYASAGTYTVTMTAKDTGNLTSAPVTKQVTVTNPVTPTTTFDARVAADADDAEESSSGSVSITGSDLELVNDGNNQVVGFRFPNLNIWSGATITSAWIQLTADESQSEATILTFNGQLVANAPAFTTSTRNVSTRARTTNAITWAPDSWTTGGAGVAQKTPELKSIVQEIVSQGGWAPGNAIAFIVTGTGHRTAEPFQSGSNTIWPLLHIEYTGGTPPPNNAPVAVLNVTATGLTANASAAGSTDTDAFPIASYTLAWGDGTANTTVNAPTQTASHNYAAAGTYTVTLTAKDTGNLTSAPVTKSITVSSGGGTGGLPLAVWASYYSTHHSYNPQPKPTPWMGSPNVVFVGTPDSPSSGGWDSAGIRFDNLSSSPITMTVTCQVGSKTFALWGTRTLPANGTLILAQTGFENFDGSDTNPAGCYDCNPNLCLTAVQSTVPVVNVTINGVTTKYYDPQQTINTNGVDYAGCPKTAGRNDESRGWVRIYTSQTGAAPVATNMYEGDPNTQILGLSWLAPVFPNPVRGGSPLTLQFSVGLKGPAEIAIYDVAGRLVRTELTHEFEPGQYQKMIPVQGLVSGMYYCTLKTKEGTLRQSFVVAE